MKLDRVPDVRAFLSIGSIALFFGIVGAIAWGRIDPKLNQPGRFQLYAVNTSGEGVICVLLDTANGRTSLILKGKDISRVIEISAPFNADGKQLPSP